jgi:enamine deaminase RidA (YjgF/YER057c/UK114 family)
MADFAGMNVAWEKWVAPTCTPARATIEAKLANPGYRVEIMCIAAL